MQTMADGKGCICSAWNSSECACDADWTPQEVYDLRGENKRLREKLREVTRAFKQKAKHVDNLLKLKRNKHSNTVVKK